MYRARDSVTSESVAFQWRGPKAPTQEDIGKIFSQRRTAKTKITQAQEPTWQERAVKYGTEPLRKVLEPMRWQPVESVKEIGRGLGLVSEPTGEPPERVSPRRALHGALGLIAPPAIAATAAFPALGALRGLGAGGVAMGRGAAALSQARAKTLPMAAMVGGITAAQPYVEGAYKAGSPRYRRLKFSVEALTPKSFDHWLERRPELLPPHEE